MSEHLDHYSLPPGSVSQAEACNPRSGLASHKAVVRPMCVKHEFILPHLKKEGNKKRCICSFCRKYDRILFKNKPRRRQDGQDDRLSRRVRRYRRPKNNPWENTKDFGPGFYCTIIREQAERWTRRYNTPVVSTYAVRMDTGLKILEFISSEEVRI